jgi:hypothetical protein
MSGVGAGAVHDAALTELQDAKRELSIAKQRIRELEIDNSVLAKRAALAVTQEADALAPVFAAKAQTQPCYRCDHSPSKPDPECPCCRNDHTPDADGNFPEAA